MKTLEKIGYAAVVTPFAVGFVALAFVYAMACCYVGQLVWAWHVVPIAAWIPVLTWKQMWAVNAVRNVAFSGFKLEPEKKEEDGAKIAAKLVGLAVAPLFVLAAGWWLR